MYQSSTSSDALLRNYGGPHAVENGLSKTTKRIAAALIAVALCAGVILVAFDVIQTNVTTRIVALDDSASISLPLSLAPKPNRRLRYLEQDPSRAVYTLQKMLLRPNQANLRMRFKPVNGPELFMNDPFIDIGGKKFLRTSLLDAVWDYHESSEAKALVNQVMIVQNFEFLP
jgi:hypothetical protein